MPVSTFPVPRHPVPTFTRFSTVASPRSAGRAALALVVMILGAGVSPALALPTLIAIDNIPGAAAGSYVVSLSSDGTAVTGQAFPPGSEGTSVFRWTLGGGTQNLGNPPGGDNAIGTGISGDGSVIAGTEFRGGSISAFRWTSGGGFQSIGSLEGNEAITSGISADGSGIVGLGSVAGASRAFRWTSGGGMQNLGVLPGGTGSEATGISGDASVVVGVSDLSAGGNRAFRWTSGGGMQNLGLLPGASDSIAYAVSGDGAAVTGISGGRAFRWTEGVGMQAIGTLPGQTISDGLALSDDGSAIVGGSGSGFGTAAYLWTAEMGMVDLNLYLPTLGIDLTGWTLEFANGISFDGRTIAGNGVFNGESRGWVVTGIPEPGACGLLALSGLTLARRRRH